MMGSCTCSLFHFACTWTINKCSNTIHKCCNNQYRKKNNHAQEHKKYPGKTLLKQGEKLNNPLLYSQEKIPQHHRPSTQEGAYKNPEPSAQERCALQPYMHLLKFWVDKWECVQSSMGIHLYLYNNWDNKRCVYWHNRADLNNSII